MEKFGNALELEKTMVDEAVTSLSQKPIKSTTFERIRLLHEANLLNENLPWQQRYSNNIYYLLENCSTPVMPHDLILGRIEDKVLSDEEEKIFQSLARNHGRPNGFRDGGHKSFYWKRLLEKGLNGLKNEALEQLQKRKAKNDFEDKILFLEGSVKIYDALILFAKRYAEAAKKAGLFEAAATCEAISGNAPSSFREALQLLWFVQMIYCSYLAANSTLTYGRLDLLLENFYNNDVKSGALDREQARLLVLDYYCKNNLIMGRGEHQLSAVEPDKVTGWARNLCYDAPQYLYVGGHRPDGSVLDGELTHLLIETIVPFFKNPVIVVRYSPQMQSTCPKLWRTITQKMYQSSSLIVYNEKQVISGFEFIGADKDDAENFEHYGCNHPTLPAMERVLNYEGIVPAALFNDILQEWTRTGHEPSSTEELFSAIEDIVKQKAIEIINRQTPFFFHEIATQSPVLEFADCFSRYTIPSAASHMGMGSKYFFVNISICSFASFVDSFTAVDTLVIREKRLTLSRLMEAINKNFEGFTHEYALCKKAPKLGSDDAISNAFAKELMIRITSVINDTAKEFLPKDIPYPLQYDDAPVKPKLMIRFSTQSDNHNIEHGAALCATPDGRFCGAPLSQNTSPSIGSSTNGLTARLSSLASIPFHRLVAGAQNLSIQKSIFNGEEGLGVLAALLGTYFDKGGLQLQVTSVDTKTLKEAQKNPDAHRDLLVRITGYSAIFTDLSTYAQDQIINREEMQ